MGETIKAVRPPRWTAGPDGIPHAHQERSWQRPAVRTVCGKPGIDERHKWPDKEMRCSECVIELGLAGAAR